LVGWLVGLSAGLLKIVDEFSKQFLKRQALGKKTIIFVLG